MNTNLAHRATVPTKLDTQLDFVLLDGSSSMADKWWEHAQRHRDLCQRTKDEQHQLPDRPHHL